MRSWPLGCSKAAAHGQGLVALSELPVFSFTATDPMGQPAGAEANAEAMEQLLADLTELCTRRSALGRMATES